jgi:Protein of unknown function (DUF3592)
MTQTLLRRVLLGAGALLAIYGAVRWWHGERVFARMRPTACTLVVKSVESELLVMRSSRRMGRNSRLRYRDEARMVFAHTVDGRKYTFREDFHADEMPLDDFAEGNVYSCRYDPQDPRRATITTAFDRREATTALLVAGILIVLGILTPRIWRQAAADFARMRERVW